MPADGDADSAVLRGACVVLGVTGGVAAYKAVEICRRLVDAGAHVVPVLTRAATEFGGAATFSALASEPVQTALFGGPDPIPHTRLGRRADLVVVAPATARLIGEYAAGISADLLVATLLATRAPVLICPAMHTEMWEHPAVQDNVARLVARGVAVVEPAAGRLAGGDTGTGRLADPADIVAAAAALLRRPRERARDLEGVRVLVTAGGTREPLDAVRVIANRSSGRQGHALAEEAAARGARVRLVTAAELDAPAGVEVVRVETAAQLASAVHAAAPESDVIVMAAAVADFRPAAPIPGKWKKRDGPPPLLLEPTEDVLAALGARRRPGQVLVGFAAEAAAGPAALVAAARAKLEEKGADLVVANDVREPGAGFGGETNAVTIVGRTGEPTRVPLGSKRTIAAAVLDAVVRLRAAGSPPTGQQGDEQ